MPYKDKEQSRAYHREYKRLRRAGESSITPGTTQLPLSFRLETAQSILELLAEQVQAVRIDKESGVLEKARCVGYLAAIALKAIENAGVEARLAALEQILKVR